MLNAHKRDGKVYTNRGTATKLWLQTSTPHWYTETSSAKKLSHKFRATELWKVHINTVKSFSTADIDLIRNTATIMQQQQELVLNDIFTTYQPKMSPTILLPNA
jgi:hypothetical protein